MQLWQRAFKCAALCAISSPSNGLVQLLPSLSSWASSPLLIRYATTAQTESLLRFCVVGSGPAGFYTVSQLLKTFGDHARVDIVDRLPTPFGLVRSGVAPDHPETKNVINQFTELGRDPRVRFLGNVRVGTDVPLSDLRTMYSAVILAYGAESNRVLDIPGRHLEGVFTAREFVWWYNGHPEYRQLPINLKQTERVAILGLGNVALDCARILLQPPQRLQTTDIADHTLQQLRESSVRRVDVIGRRGPAQAAFTAKELREVLRMEGISVVLPHQALQTTAADKAELKASRSKKRVFDLLKSAAEQPVREGDKELHMHFLRSPVEVQPGDLGRAGALKLQVMRLESGAPGGTQRAVPTGEEEVLQAEMVLESIGYRSIPLPGAPFDDSRGVIPNRQGRVLSSTAADAEVEQGLYVVGWVKRGPTGIIGTNLVDASETVQAITQDAVRGQLGPVPPPTSNIEEQLEAAGKKVVTFEDWERIDAKERERGIPNGRPRVKFVDEQEMLQACHA